MLAARAAQSRRASRVKDLKPVEPVQILDEAIVSLFVAISYGPDIHTTNPTSWNHVRKAYARLVTLRKAQDPDYTELGEVMARYNRTPRPHVIVREEGEGDIDVDTLLAQRKLDDQP